MLGTVLVIVLLLALLGALPRWPHSRSWGYYPTGGVGLVVIVVVYSCLLGEFKIPTTGVPTGLAALAEL